ncbi:TetR/AcrR family transcriptional regulator [Antrihabitans sp. YC2-6]|uniref:TetR/AcrR family transcriptional regulator n=1 Tax=Antrihabitans sp. YC2-6 TaxID=2799498 RepID=UPI0018F2C7A8|nr:TetR/AcrR family transcriptional regulator [Antrihabitans sp. YC2-6]MBJ8347783.1 TetR/AcrR family transcriptional regulator [Antrihabitans sp. YC2-6]
MSQDSVGRTYAGQLVEDRQKERRARFLESGLTVFARDGYANSSVGAICKDAGLSSRQFYEVFSGREAVLTELFTTIDRDSLEAVGSALAENASAGVSRMIEAGTRAYISSVGADPRRAKVAIVEAVGASTRLEQYRVQQRTVWGAMMASVAEVAATQGKIPAGDYQMRVSALLGAVNYVVYDWSIAEPRPSLDDVIRVLTRILTGAIGAVT